MNGSPCGQAWMFVIEHVSQMQSPLLNFTLERTRRYAVVEWEGGGGGRGGGRIMSSALCCAQA